LRYLCDAPHGAVIVNNADVLGWRTQHSQSHYAAAKAEVTALTRCSAREAVEDGVRINAVSPSIARRNRHPELPPACSPKADPGRPA
jgi:3-oxoacyl-[acyl-carrier protein] reductase